VGGRNAVAMTDLREAFEANGYKAVRTYINSGNVLFESDIPQNSLEESLEQSLEKVLQRRFGISIAVMLRSHRQLRSVIQKAPDGFGQKPTVYHSDVVFLKGSLSSRTALRSFDPREGVDQAWPGNGVLYFSRLTERLTQSRMGRIASTPEYKQMTIRNWNTTTKLLGLLG